MFNIKFYIIILIFNFSYGDLVYRELLKYLQKHHDSSFGCHDSVYGLCDITNIQLTDNKLTIKFTNSISTNQPFSYSFTISETNDGELTILSQDYSNFNGNFELYKPDEIWYFFSKTLNTFKFYILHSHNKSELQELLVIRIGFTHQIPIYREQQTSIKKITIDTKFTNIPTQEKLVEKLLSESYDNAIRSGLLTHDLADKLDTIQFDPKVCYNSFADCFVKAVYFIDKVKKSLLLLRMSCVNFYLECINFKKSIDWGLHYVVVYKNKNGQFIILDPIFASNFKQNFKDWFKNFTLIDQLDIEVVLYNPIYM